MFKETVTRYVDAGKVYCEVRKSDVDVDLCLGCPRLDDLRRGPDGDEVRCVSPDRQWGVLLAR